MASDFDDMQRRAMGILSDASQKVMGKVSLVYQTIKNAYETGDLVDYLTASSVFNALPGTKRNQIGHSAFEQARESVGKAEEPAQAPAKLPTPALLTPIIEAMPVRPSPPRPAEIEPPAPKPAPVRPAAIEPAPKPVRPDPVVVPLERPQPPKPAPAPLPVEEKPAAASNVIEMMPNLPKAPPQPTVVAPIEKPVSAPAASRAASKTTTEKVWASPRGAAAKIAPLPDAPLRDRPPSGTTERPQPHRTPRPGGS
jgi:hypothetical protein